MTDLLEGLTVLEISHGVAGAMAGMLMADNGARVIKLEPPGGDPFRALPPFRVWNRGKESIVLDLGDPGQTNRFHDLCKASDVLLQTLKPQTANCLGLDYANLKNVAPHLVYTAISGYGQGDQRRNEPGYDALLAARYGTYSDQGGPRSGPHFCPQHGPSMTAALLAVVGTLAAVLHRSRSGRGQLVDTSLLDGLANQASMYWGWSEKPIRRLTPAYSSGKLVSRLLLQLGILECGDGRHLIIHTGAPGRFQVALELFGLADRVTPATSAQEMDLPLTPEEAELIESEVKAQLMGNSRDYWVAKIQEADIAVSPVDPPGAVLHDDQAVHNGAVALLQDPEWGQLRAAGPLLLTPDTMPGVVELPPAPAVGQHTEAVLAELDTNPWRPSMLPVETPAPITYRAPLEGLRVVDFGAFYAGPFGPKMLADLGADVIKVEALTGDPMRPLTAAFAPANRNKRCIGLNLKTDAGREIAYALVRGAHAVAQNLRPGAAERLGIGFDQLRAINPNITYLYGPGWGSSGPKAGLQSFAPLMSALCGMMVAAGGPDNPPIASAGGNEDCYNGLLGACGALMGILRMRQTGAAQYVEGPQINSTLFATSEVMLDASGERLFAFHNDHDQTGLGALYRIYECRDDWVCLVVIKDREWQALTRVPGLQHIAGDIRFGDRDARTANTGELATALTNWFSTRSATEVCRQLSSCGVPCERVYPPQNVDYFFDDENLALERVVEYEHPITGRMREQGRSIRFSETPGPPLKPFPLRGEHTRELLLELGYSNDDIRLFCEQQVVGWDPALDG